MTDPEFKRLATGQCLYVTGIPLPFLIVEAGTERGNRWVLCPDDDFHILALRGLSESREGEVVTWRDANGSPALVIAPLASCEELSTGDALIEMDQARAQYATLDGKAWVQQQLAGAAEASVEQTTWVIPSTVPAPGV